MSDDATTYRKRKAQYDRRVSMILWVGAGLAGLVAITTGDAFDASAPAWLKALEISLIIVCASFFARARVKFEWEATRIQRRIEDEKIKADEDPTLPADMQEWPRVAEECWDLSISTLTIAGLVMALCFWWPVFLNLYAHMTAGPENPQIQNEKR